MESHVDEERDFNKTVIDNLVNIFGHILTKEVITTLVESYGGDLNQSVDAIMEITNDGNMIPREDIEPSTSLEPNSNTPSQESLPVISYSCAAESKALNEYVDAIIENKNHSTLTTKEDEFSTTENPQDQSFTSQTQNKTTPLPENQPSISYAHTSERKGAIPKRIQKTSLSNQYFWTDQIRKIITHHNNGFRVLIIMRGLPGSGKTHLSKLLVESLIGPSIANERNHIFSADDYFIVGGQYQYDKSYISHAHSWNQNRVRLAATQGVSPIIVDNTNIATWEMHPYVIEGVNNGYFIEVVEPKTPWAKKVKQLSNINTHNVPMLKIKRMLENYDENITGESLMHSFLLKYSESMVPPVLRLIPPILSENNISLSFAQPTTPTQNIAEKKSHNQLFQYAKLADENFNIKSDITSTIPPATSIQNIEQDEPRNQLFQYPIQADPNCVVQPDFTFNFQLSDATQNVVQDKSCSQLCQYPIQANGNIVVQSDIASTSQPSTLVQNIVQDEFHNKLFQYPMHAEKNLGAQPDRNSKSEPSTPTQNILQNKSSYELFQNPLQTDQNFAPKSDVIIEDSGHFTTLTEPYTIDQIEDLTEEEQVKQKNILEAQKKLDELQKVEEEPHTIDQIEDLTEEEQVKQKIILEAQKKLDELQKVEEDWENGETWGDTEDGAAATKTEVIEIVTPDATSTTSDIHVTTSFMSNLESKPPRNKNVEESHYETTNNAYMQSILNCEDWRYIVMPPWESQDKQHNIALASEAPIETVDSSTCVEMYDTSIPGKHKVITATSRNINELYLPPAREKIPDKRMLDKSTMTNEGIIMTVHCPQKERHFFALRQAFKSVERESLRYVFDNCCGDVNWAMGTILGGESENEIKESKNGKVLNSEEEPDFGSDQACTCLAEYGIIPNISNIDMSHLIPRKKITERSIDDSMAQSEKKRRPIKISPQNMQLKKQIEQNIDISDSHYSEHCLKIKKFRRGEYNKFDNVHEQPSTSGTSDAALLLDSSNPTPPIIDDSDDDDGSDSNVSESDKIVNINLGRMFIKELDSMFGRKDMEYPDNIQYKVSIPTSLLNEINALWIESMMYQIDENEKKAAEMVKQDEEFARQLEIKEKELISEGKEPAVPDFKEIMDLEFAINLHIKDISEWRNNIPTDLAAKMTHDKLFNLFPEIEGDTLLEMLIAHDNNFKATVEVLLISLGREEILETENGLNKFVMEKEIQRQERLLAEQRKALSEKEWPPLPKGEKIEMSTVLQFREDAEKHLQRRNTHMQKAEEYIRRGMIQVANYYSDIANFHKTQYEQANSRAVSTLMQYHAENHQNSETVDLHYFRVKEAKEAMDLFIDTHIQRLRDTNKRGVMLFFITGRGLHSPGLPRVKPACIKRLRERGLQYTECNPGLLRSHVTCNDKLTFQIP